MSGVVVDLDAHSSVIRAAHCVPRRHEAEHRRRRLWGDEVEVVAAIVAPFAHEITWREGSLFVVRRDGCVERHPALAPVAPGRGILERSRAHARWSESPIATLV